MLAPACKRWEQGQRKQNWPGPDNAPSSKAVQPLCSWSSWVHSAILGTPPIRAIIYLPQPQAVTIQPVSPFSDSRWPQATIKNSFKTIFYAQNMQLFKYPPKPGSLLFCKKWISTFHFWAKWSKLLYAVLLESLVVDKPLLLQNVFVQICAWFLV